MDHKISPIKTNPRCKNANAPPQCYVTRTFLVLLYIFGVYTSQWPRGLRRGSAAAHCGFKSRLRHGCLSLVSVVCLQVEVSATSRSLVQRGPIERGAPHCE